MSHLMRKVQIINENNNTTVSPPTTKIEFKKYTSRTPYFQ